ncbi:PREDICTED: uncharacterized protein C6orf226 homolog [Poecilia mexicana]|uniref:uncharacterized protein C6orf226 homolog n=1 Tax=Poecilia mexicana TaxID=48701 RepID=UPI00072DECB8|nr:PREDICTED: uncharacterized protein C6orf226 homolog [Poecilia mexicana]
MESVFSRFDSYNFEADERFVDGLKTLNCREQTELLKLKLFFYNRFVEPIDQQSYKRWISLSCNNQQDQTAQSDPDSNETETSADGETKQLSFAEVMQLVQEGKEVPGVTKPDVQPSNQSPTPSQMQRVQKPWETTPS